MDEVRVKEFEAAQEVLGYRHAHFLGLPDGYVGADMAGLVACLDGVFRKWQPTEVYLPYPSMHQDHTATYEAGIRSSRLSMHFDHWFPPMVLVYDVSAYDVNLYPTDLRWNVFESLTAEHIDKKVQALLAYESQRVLGPHPANEVKTIAQALGASRRVDFAEQYALVRGVRP
jgi:LmbE family N-acetylglucosaminyl deacetylase